MLGFFRKDFEGMVMFSDFLNMPAENDNLGLRSSVLTLFAAAT